MCEMVLRRAIPVYSLTSELGRTIFESAIILAFFVPMSESFSRLVLTVEAEFCWSTGGDLWAMMQHTLISLNWWALLTMCTAQDISPRKLPILLSGVQQWYHSRRPWALNNNLMTRMIICVYIYIYNYLCAFDHIPFKGENATSFGHQLGRLSLV